MKTAFATLACMLIAGLATAQTTATVAGNNTAVVIMKDAVWSSNGYQFLCVPVNGLDITAGSATSATLDDLLPSASYDVGTEVRTVDAAGTVQATYTLGADGWRNGGVSAGTTPIAGGTVFWLKKPTQANGATGDISALLGAFSASTPETLEVAASTPVVFCGETRAITPGARPTAMSVMKNEGSAAIKIAEIATLFTDGNKPKAGDQVLLVKEGSSEYVRWLRGRNDANVVWYKGGTVAAVDTDTIAAGEAFYYYPKSSVSN